MRKFYQIWPNPQIVQTPSEEFAQGIQDALLPRFPLSWSHYVRLLSVEKPPARALYEAEALRGGWTVRPLDRQIGTQFYERALLELSILEQDPYLPVYRIFENKTER